MTPEQEKTLEGRKGKVTFGFAWETCQYKHLKSKHWVDKSDGGRVHAPESAHNNMVGRGLESLGEKWAMDWRDVFTELAGHGNVSDDMLAAILAASEK